MGEEVRWSERRDCFIRVQLLRYTCSSFRSLLEGSSSAKAVFPVISDVVCTLKTGKWCPTLTYVAGWVARETLSLPHSVLLTFAITTQPTLAETFYLKKTM